MRPWLVILVVAAVARFALVFAAEPALSDDIWRYVFDGRHLASGVNPYAVSPMDAAARDPSPWLRRINHPQLVTIYQPVSQAVFGGAWLTYVALGDAAEPAGAERVFRGFFVLADLAIVAVLLWSLQLAGRSAWWAAAYAWHPLAVVEVAWSGHQDVLGILPLAGALLLATGRDAAGRGAAAGVLLAMAIAVKPLVAPLALPLAWRTLANGDGRRGVPAVAAAAAACLLALAALYLPFALMPGGLDGMADTVRTFVDKWAFNGSIHPLLTSLVGDAWADALCGGLLLATLGACLALRLDAVESAVLYLVAALLLSSTAHPWYLLWALAVAPLRPALFVTPAVWAWSVTIALSYTARATPDFQPPTWVVFVEYAPVYATLGLGVALAWRRRTVSPWARGPASSPAARPAR